MSTVLRLRMSPSPPRLQVDSYSPTNHKMDLLCANQCERLSIQLTLCPCLCLCSSVSLCVSVCLCVPGCLPLSVGFSFGPCVCVCLSILTCMCTCLCCFLVREARYGCWHQLRQRCNRCVADPRICCSRHKLKKDIPT